MVRILTEDFIELDLAPGYEFQIEMSNPMFDSGHLPEAFSTQIPFPPSPTNRDKFGYTPVLMRPPGIQRLAASIWIGGVPFMYGTLVYDGIEDGALLYTFTCKIPDLEAKIWDQALLEFTTDNIPDGSSSFFKTPLVIRSDNVAMQPYLNGPVDDNLWVKYWNYKTTGKSFDYDSFLPAVPVSAIIGWLGLEASIELRYLLDSIVILGRFHEFAAGDVVTGNSKQRSRSETGAGISSTSGSSRRTAQSYSNTGTSSGSGGRSRGASRRTSKVTDLASFLPDVTFAELLKGIGSMLCCSFYMEGGTLRMIRNSSVLEGEPLDWRGKVSDKFSAGIQAAATYKFGYVSDSKSASMSELGPRSTHYVEAGAEGTFNPAIILNALATTGLYSVVWDQTTGDLFSGRSYAFGSDASEKPSGYSAPNVFDCDVLYHNAKPVALEVEDEDSETFDNSCVFELVRCVPEKIFPNSGSGAWPSDSAATYRMTPIVDPPQVSEGRDSKVYVGIIDNSLDQMTDKDLFLPGSPAEEVLLGNNSLAPDDLWESHHETFAEWTARRRQTVKADVELSPADLQSFRIYQPVYFAGKRWVVKTISMTIVATSDLPSVTCEFVEL